MRTPPELYANIGHWIREFAMRAFFIEFSGGAIAANFLIADKNLNAQGVNGNSAAAYRRQNAAPIRVGSRPRGFNQHRMCDRTRRQ